MKNWKIIFKKKHSSRSSRAIAVNSHKVDTLRGEPYPVPVDVKADAEAAKQGDAVYARCGEVFRQP
jgi:hypothetical protein